ncbi:putative NRPS-like protein biosynthetic cluster [Gnomoniopsis sp. IMI 355080]|nr:putative NRPS-like protein biosynthetic cluster [Gnomoniopsis sp. IMI 355080]
MRSKRGPLGGEYGHRLIPQVIDDIAAEDPLREAFQFPRTEDPKDGWDTITFENYANAINRCAWMIIETCGKSTEGSFPTIAYIGPQDARYVVMIFAAVKVGYRALYISPRNSEQGQLNLFEKADCNLLAFAQSYRAMVQPLLRKRPMKAFEVKSFREWFSSEKATPISYGKTFEQAEWEPLCVLHTSGSTGLPKPVVVTHMPLFHSGALYGFIFFAIYWDTPIALGIPDMMLSWELAMDCLDNLNVEATVLPPSILEEMCQSERCMETLKDLKIVAFGGVYFQPKAALWNYFIFNSELLGGEWREAHDDTYELVVVRKDPDHPGTQGFFYTFPDLQEYGTKDLYRPHHSLPHHWTYYGRADNIIVFSNGEKLNPVTIEDACQSHPQIKGALVVGSNRFQAGLLLEPLTPISDEKQKIQLIESIWPLVERVNNETVGHGRIGRAYIAITSQPFLRAGKGTVQRAMTVDLLSDDIEKLYGDAERLKLAALPSLDISSMESLADSIRKIVESERPDLQLAPDTNIFSVGVDSRHTINTARLIRASLEAIGHAAGPDALGPRVIYNNPTCRRLAQYIFHCFLQTKEAVEGESNQEQYELDIMKALHTKYTRDLPKAKPGRPGISSHNQTLILTGSTGMVGSHLLNSLAQEASVSRIICLNRASDGGTLQQAHSMTQRGLPSTYKTKAEFYHADTSLPSFGLSEIIYSNLLDATDRVIHCAWPVNFNFSTETFEPSIRGVRHLADFAADARKRVAVIFISSISTAARWDPSQGDVPEEAITQWSLPAPSGYGRSKMVASLVLDAAGATNAGDFPAATIRLGQVAGSEAEDGSAWSVTDWLPSLVRSSVHLGALPRDLGTADRVDWLPIETAAALVLDIALAPSHEVRGYFHGVNTNAVSWGELVPAVWQAYEGRIREMVSFGEWLARLEESRGVQDAADGLVDANPGLKLLDTYRAMMVYDTEGQAVVFDTRRTSSISPSLRKAMAVSPELMGQWCAQWKF